MSLDTLIADTRKAIAGDAANAHAVFTAAVDEHCSVLDLFKNPCRSPARSPPRAEVRRRRRSA
jgi:hypothetical protein